jgi:hypothetical protein
MPNFINAFCTESWNLTVDGHFIAEVPAKQQETLDAIMGDIQRSMDSAEQATVTMMNRSRCCSCFNAIC